MAQLPTLLCFCFASSSHRKQFWMKMVRYTKQRSFRCVSNTRQCSLCAPLPKAAWTWRWGAEVCSAASKGAASPFQHNSRSWSCREREMKEVRGATASLRCEGICRKGRRPQEMCGICLPGSSCGRVDTRPYTLTPGWCWHFQKSGDHWLTYLISSEVYSSC